MQSILTGLGAPGAGGGAHGHLADLAPAEVADARHVVLFVVDGLGRAQLDAGPAPALRASLRGTMTSVFPSTTASAVTTFLTGLAPVEHAVTGWFMWLRELDSIIAPLPFTTRAGGDRSRLARHRAGRRLRRAERLRAGARGLPRGPARRPGRLVVFARAHARGDIQGLRGAGSAGRFDPRHRPAGPAANLRLRLLAGARHALARIRRVERRGPAPPGGDRRGLPAPARRARRKRHAARGDRGPRLRRHPSRIAPGRGIRSRPRADALAAAVRRAAPRLLLRARRTPRGLRRARRPRGSTEPPAWSTARR